MAILNEMGINKDKFPYNISANKAYKIHNGHLIEDVILSKGEAEVQAKDEPRNEKTKDHSA